MTRACALPGCDEPLTGKQTRFCCDAHRLTDWKATKGKSPTKNGTERHGTGRTFWWMKDQAWWRRARIAHLGIMYGSLGPSAVDWLSCHASELRDDGRVKSGYAAVATGIFEVEQWSKVRAAIKTAAVLGLLDDFEERDDENRFTCRISGWADDQRAAVRRSPLDVDVDVDVDKELLLPPDVLSREPFADGKESE